MRLFREAFVNKCTVWVTYAISIMSRFANNVFYRLCRVCGMGYAV